MWQGRRAAPGHFKVALPIKGKRRAAPAAAVIMPPLEKGREGLRLLRAQLQNPRPHHHKHQHINNFHMSVPNKCHGHGAGTSGAAAGEARHTTAVAASSSLREKMAFCSSSSPRRQRHPGQQNVPFSPVWVWVCGRGGARVLGQQHLTSPSDHQKQLVAYFYFWLELHMGSRMALRFAWCSTVAGARRERPKEG
jgi:hypothetical protein